MSSSFLIFAVVIVMITCLILLSDFARVLLGGEWFVYKVTDCVDRSTSVMRTRKPKESNRIYQYELEGGPIYEGSNKLIHIIAMLVITYFANFWIFLLAVAGIILIWFFATEIYFIYAGGIWENVHRYNEEQTNWQKIGKTQASKSKLPVRDFGWQKWIIYYLLFASLFVWPEHTRSEILFYFVGFIVLHILFSFEFKNIDKENQTEQEMMS